MLGRIFRQKKKGVFKQIKKCLGTTKGIKNKELKLEFIGGHVLGRTDPDGEMDIIFKCNSTFKKKAITVIVGNYRKTLSSENFPKNIELMPDDCKQTN